MTTALTHLLRRLTFPLTSLRTAVLSFVVQAFSALIVAVAGDAIENITPISPITAVAVLGFMRFSPCQDRSTPLLVAGKHRAIVVSPVVLLVPADELLGRVVAARSR